MENNGPGDPRLNTLMKLLMTLRDQGVIFDPAIHSQLEHGKLKVEVFFHLDQ